MRFHGLTSQTLDSDLSREALQRIRSQPGVFVKELGFNATAYYFPGVAEVFRPVRMRNFWSEKLALTILHVVVWSFVGLGLWRVRKREDHRQLCWLLLLCVGLYAVWYFPFRTSVSHTMYTFATMPILAILAALGGPAYRREIRAPDKGSGRRVTTSISSVV